MATELSIKTDTVEQFFDDLEAQRAILSSCTQLFKTLSSHFTSLQESLSRKSESLDSKFLSLESTSTETLQSLSQREYSIPEREAAAVALLNDQKEAAVEEFRKPAKSTDLSETLKSLCRKMDSSGLLKFIISKRKESMSLRAEISGAITESVDPPRLLLDAVEEFLVQKMDKIGVTDKRWACGMLVQALFPEGNNCKKAVGPEFARRVVDRAAGILERWKEQMLDTELGPAEAVMFLQMVVGFGLSSRFDNEFLRKLVLDFASRRDMARLAACLGFDIIDELVKNGKEIEAVYFASESSLTERFPPVSLLKSHLRNSKRKSASILKNGNYSNAATEDSTNMELNSIKAIIKCIEDHKLQSEFSVDSLRKRAAQLEKNKAARKKSSATNSKPQNKRGHGSSSSRSGGPPTFRPAKAAKFSNAYQSFGRRNPAPPTLHSPAARYSTPYNYPNQTVYEGAAAAQYATTYGVPHSQSPASIPQQHYSLPVDNIVAGGLRASGSNSSQTGYGVYDYSSAPASSYQSQSYTQ
ncbi:FRIGIDA-like protein 4a isoform X2 [Mangifera indica]|uniref:FRIGIDA-like protein 4a isoform X2 n=1 Tax=Mangifera indica TaxID=29780 RepID=UPI001CFC06F0|nr:FRIGIDA-like protein 4a isoform X2 [Mangifera indica]